MEQVPEVHWRSSLGAEYRIQTATDQYREFLRKVLVDERIAELEVDREASRQEVQRLSQIADAEFEKLTDLQRQKLNMGAEVLDRLEEDIKAAEAEKPVRMAKRDQAAAACQVMGWAVPDSVVWFVQRVDAAKQRVLKSRDLKKELEARKDQLKADHRKASEDFTKAVAEVKALERQKSNLPARLVDLRERMARDLSIPEEKLPFVGELVEVRADSAEWQGAIERVLGGFARAILVEDKNYSAVSGYLNERNIGERLVYFRTIQQTSGRTPGPNSLVRKLNLASGSFGDWVREELKHAFDLECADTIQAFRNAPRAVTREGLVKHSTTRHEKNDRHNVNDRSQWVLGFDNKEKLALYQNQAAELGGRISGLQTALEKIGDEEDAQQEQLLHCQNLSNLTWNDVDVGALLARIDDLTERLKAEKAARPDLAVLGERIEAQDGVHRKAVDVRNKEDVKGQGIARDIDKLNGKLAELARLWPTSDKAPAFSDEIAARYEAVGKEVTLENLDQTHTQVDRGLSNELRALESRLTELKGAIVQRFVEFNRLWPAVAGGLDATLASAEDYLAKLKRLEDDNLPAYEDRFFSLRIDVGYPQAHQVFAFQAQQPACRCIGIAKGAVGPDLQERVAGLFDSLAGQQQLVLCLLPFGHVARRRDQPGHTAVCAEERQQREVHRQHRATACCQAHVEAGGFAAQGAGQRLLQPLESCADNSPCF